MTAKQAIYFVREKRPGSVQVEGQIVASKEFESFLRPLRVVYEKFASATGHNEEGEGDEQDGKEEDDDLAGATITSNVSNLSTISASHQQQQHKQQRPGVDISFDLITFLSRQRIFLHGEEQRRLRYVPKVENNTLKLKQEK